jgi:hypothetical protein
MKNWRTWRKGAEQKKAVRYIGVLTEGGQVQADNQAAVKEIQPGQKGQVIPASPAGVIVGGVIFLK